MTFPRRVLFILLSLLLTVSGISAAPAQISSSDGQFFEETRHWVRDEFLDYWNQSPDPLLLFGYPITEAMPHPMRPGIQVQFFQRARMEFDSSLPDGEQVTLASLGAWMYDDAQRGEPASFPVTNTACRRFGESGSDVCYAFLQFYDRYNGALYFGEPISNAEFLDGRLVQYFQNARMEWRPEQPAGRRVVLTDIGRLNFDITIGDRSKMNPLSGAQIPVSQLTQIQVYAFVERPLLASGQQQKLFVVVHDQFQTPIQDVQIRVTVSYPDGRSENFRPDRTNADGLTAINFVVEDVDPNQVVQISVDGEIPNGPKGQASAWFRIWW